MPLGIEVGLGVRDTVGCELSYPQKNAHTRPIQFLAHVYCGQMAGWMNTPLRTEVDLGPGHILLDGVPAPRKGAQRLPSFWPICLLWPRSPISATAELLYLSLAGIIRLSCKKCVKRSFVLFVLLTY